MSWLVYYSLPTKTLHSLAETLHRLQWHQLRINTRTPSDHCLYGLTVHSQQARDSSGPLRMTMSSASTFVSKDWRPGRATLLHLHIRLQHQTSHHQWFQVSTPSHLNTGYGVQIHSMQRTSTNLHQHSTHGWAMRVRPTYMVP
jgi:hypothetical protein